MPGIPLDEVRQPMVWDKAVKDSHLFGSGSQPEDLVRERDRTLQNFVDEFLSACTEDGFDDSAPLASYDFDDEEDKPQDEAW